MITLTGEPVGTGTVFGKICVYSREESKIKRIHIENISDEIRRFECASARASFELGELYERALCEAGEETAKIFFIHQMMLEDYEYTESVKNIIADQSVNAETAVAQTCDNFVRMFEELEDDYISAKAADIKDISERVIRVLQDTSRDDISSVEPVILVAEDLTPSEVIQADRDKILALVTEGGSVGSHTSILAEKLNIPTVVCVYNAFNMDYNGKEAIVNAAEGKVYIDPDDETILRIKQSNLQNTKEL